VADGAAQWDGDGCFLGEAGGQVCEFVSGSEEVRVFFFEKKNQKTFAILARRCLHLRGQLAKVFGFLSSEKKTLLSYPGENQ
jgi:hypothetical protein